MRRKMLQNVYFLRNLTSLHYQQFLRHDGDCASDLNLGKAVFQQLLPVKDPRAAFFW